MNKISIQALGKVALGIAFVGTGSLYGIRWMIQSKLRESVSYKEALQCFRNNANAVELLGEPIREKGIDIGDDKCYGHKDNVGWVTVPLVGKKHKGSLHYWVTVTDRKLNEFRVSRIELEIEGYKNKILLREEPVETPATEVAIGNKK